MPKILLESSSSSSEDESGEDNGLQINENYAKVFNSYREKEEFQRLKAKYGEEAAKAKLEDDLEESSSESESEDEEADKWTQEHEKDFFKTLSSLKRKDGKIYDGKTSFFKPLETTAPKRSKDDKPITLVDLERKVIVENEGQFEDLQDQQLAKKHKDKTYVQELSEIQNALKTAVESEDEEDNLLMKKQTKNAEETEKEDREYRQWLVGQKEHLKDSGDESEMKTLKDFWTDKNLDEGEKFLRDYILHKKYLNDDDLEQVEDVENLSDDEKTLEKQEEFEHKYNFRFEDPDKEFIKRYPRTIQESLRRKDESRKKKREEVKERKAKEKEQKRQELKQLKSLKRKEILEKIDKLRKITGNDELAFKDEDLEEDFDPEKYDQRMNEIFDQFDDAPFQAEDEEKPVFSDLESDLEVENWDEYDGNEHENADAEEEMMDEDAELHEAVDQLTKVAKGRKKSKSKKSKFAETLEKEKPVFDPQTNKDFQSYLDEYYKLDYEDIIGDMPCRFKYRSVPANNLGLTTEEILTAPDRELNAWASLKKTCQYRSEEEEKRDIEEYAKKEKNTQLKKKILPSLFSQDPEEQLQAEQEKKANKGKKRRRKKANKSASNDINFEAISEKSFASTAPQNRKRKRKNEKKESGKKAKIDVNKEFLMSDTRLQTYGINPKQLKRKVRKQKYSSKK